MKIVELEAIIGRSVELVWGPWDNIGVRILALNDSQSCASESARLSENFYQYMSNEIELYLYSALAYKLFDNITNPDASLRMINSQPTAISIPEELNPHLRKKQKASYSQPGTDPDETKAGGVR